MTGTSSAGKWFPRRQRLAAVKDRDIALQTAARATAQMASAGSGVVEAAKPIMVIVPRGGRLVVEAKLFNRDAGFVSVGQQVAVKLEAFPFTRFGTVPGRIEAISSDAIEDEKLGLVYPARIALERTTISRGDATVTLTPGMAATADIKIGRRSIMIFAESDR